MMNWIIAIAKRIPAILEIVSEIWKEVQEKNELAEKQAMNDTAKDLEDKILAGAQKA